MIGETLVHGVGMVTGVSLDHVGEVATPVGDGAPYQPPNSNSLLSCAASRGCDPGQAGALGTYASCASERQPGQTIYFQEHSHNSAIV